MSNLNIQYGTSNQAITVTLASLTSGSSRQSAVVDNSTNQFIDALVAVNIKSGASNTAANGYVAIYAYGTADGGTDYTDGATGSDAAFTPTSPTNLRLVGIINVVANAVTYKGGPFSVAAAFGGSLPQKWGIVVSNQSGGTLDATEGNFLKIYQGVYGQY